jgi:hypothetical protein
MTRLPCFWPLAPRTPGQGTFTPKHGRMHGTHARSQPLPEAVGCTPLLGGDPAVYRIINIFERARMRLFLLCLNLGEKIGNDAEILFWLLDVRHMGALLKDDHLGARNTVVQCFRTRRRDLIIPPDRNQGRNRNLTQAIRAILVLEIPDDDELIRTVHGFIDRIVGEVGTGALNGIRPGLR